MSRILIILALSASLVICMSGCGGGNSNVTVKGTVTDGGKAIKNAKEGDVLEVQFLFQDKEGNSKSIPTQCDDEGTFNLANALPAETDFKVAVIVQSYESNPSIEKKLWSFAPERTKMEFRTTSASVQEIDIDLAKGKITTK